MNYILLKKNLACGAICSIFFACGAIFHRKILPAAHFFAFKIFVIYPICMKPNALVIFIIVGKPNVLWAGQHSIKMIGFNQKMIGFKYSVITYYPPL